MTDNSAASAWTDLITTTRSATTLDNLIPALQRSVETIAGSSRTALAGPEALTRFWTAAFAAPCLDAISSSPRLRADSAESDSNRLVLPLVFAGQRLGAILIEGDLSPTRITRLDNVTAIAAPAIAALLAQVQLRQIDALETRRDDDLRVAETIQRSLLPESLPEVDGWSFAAHYQPARVIGGDLYDFIALPNDLLAIVLGDASDKSVQAALVMATAKALIRAAAQRLVLPAQVLAQVNDELCRQVPPGVFVTCFFGLLDTATSRFRYANAGHCAPVLLQANGPVELTASGWALGMLPGKRYDEGELSLDAGSAVVVYSDGLSEVHGSGGELFGTPRILAALSTEQAASNPIASVIEAANRFRLSNAEQDDDITLVALTRNPAGETLGSREIDHFTIPSVPDGERAAADRVLAAVANVPLTSTQRSRLHTAVAESIMNAAEHGNHFRTDLPVRIRTSLNGGELTVEIHDAGKSGIIGTPHQPDLEAKLAGLQSPRGWGLFLISKMVDRFEVRQDESGNCVALGMAIGGAVSV
jgi:serine phosphatase RsbU (regulator of sigma subunit)/anti-sigma regulatory factor (Ser/Thr protein kinase)